MKKSLIYPGLCAALLLVLIITGLYWMAVGITFLLVVFFLLFRKSNFTPWLEQHLAVATALAFLAAVILAVILRIFVFEIYRIPTGSMEATLLPGDVILVEKLSYGPAMPRSPLEIPWLNALFLLNKKAIARCDTFVWDYHRLHGTGRIRRGDVVVFRYPDNPEEAYIKRCIALPGDTLIIRNARVIINGKVQPLPQNALMEYKIRYNDENQFRRLLDSLNIGDANLWTTRHNRIYIANITSAQAELLSRSAVVDSMGLNLRGDLSDIAFYSGAATMRTDSFGPLIIPKRGLSLAWDSSRFALYGKTFAAYEGIRLSPEGSVPDPDNRFMVKGNYYFMMGDNRYRSNDSRMWGVVPEELITGKARRVLWSGGFAKFHWNRLMKKIE